MESDDEERSNEEGVSIGSLDLEGSSIASSNEERSIVSFGEEGSVALFDDEDSIASSNEEQSVFSFHYAERVEEEEHIFTMADAERAFENILGNLSRGATYSRDRPYVSVSRKQTFDVVVQKIDTFCSASGIDTIHSLSFGPRDETLIPLPLGFDFDWSSLVVNENTRDALSKLGRALHQGVCVSLDCFCLNADFATLVLESLPTIKEIALYLPNRMSSDYVEGFRSVIEAVSNHTCKVVYLCFPSMCMEIRDEWPSRFGAHLSQLLSSGGDKAYRLLFETVTFSTDDSRALGYVLAHNQSNITNMYVQNCAFEDGGIRFVSDSFRTNSTLQSLSLDDPSWDLAPLQQNSSLQELHIGRIMNTSQLEQIIEGISATNIEVLMARSVGTISLVLIGDEATRQNLLSILQKNYTLKEIKVFDYRGICEPFKVLTDLNRAGRGYLQEESWTIQQGIDVLDKVKDDLECLYFHFKENPTLCSFYSENTNGSSRQRISAITVCCFGLLAYVIYTYMY